MLSARERCIACGASEPETAVLATQMHFDSEIQKRLECIQCRKTSVRFERFRDFSLDVPGAGRDTSVEEMLRSYFAGELLELKCADCNAAAAQEEIELSASPRVLVLHLKRYVVNQEKRRYDKLYNRVSLPLEFDF